MTYEYYSSLALVSSVVVYALAMFAHAAEWAAARRVGVAQPAERELVDVAAVEMRPELSQMRPESFQVRPELVEGHRAGLPAGESSSSAGSVCR